MRFPNVSPNVVFGLAAIVPAGYAFEKQQKQPEILLEAMMLQYQDRQTL
ncbi:MAG TPA: hypothetical protein VK674_03000 [Candidatus Limnocylindria bacterium]|nr:hypothetical protein [Candidatus Limnocylindria bacterium]